MEKLNFRVRDTRNDTLLPKHKTAINSNGEVLLSFDNGYSYCVVGGQDHLSVEFYNVNEGKSTQLKGEKPL